MRLSEFLKLPEAEALEFLRERIRLARGETGRFPLDTYQLWDLDPELFRLMMAAPRWRVYLDHLGIREIDGEDWPYPKEHLFPFLVERAMHYRRRHLRLFSFDDWLERDEAGMRHAIRNELLRRIAKKMRWKLDAEYTVPGMRVAGMERKKPE